VVQGAPDVGLISETLALFAFLASFADENAVREIAKIPIREQARW